MPNLLYQLRMVDVIKEALDVHVHYKIELLQIYHLVALGDCVFR